MNDSLSQQHHKSPKFLQQHVTLLSSFPNYHRFPQRTAAVLPSADCPKFTNIFVLCLVQDIDKMCGILLKGGKTHLRSLHKAAYLECLNKVANGSQKVLHLTEPKSQIPQLCKSE